RDGGRGYPFRRAPAQTTWPARAHARRAAHQLGSGASARRAVRKSSARGENARQRRNQAHYSGRGRCGCGRDFEGVLGAAARDKRRSGAHLIYMVAQPQSVFAPRGSVTNWALALTSETGKAAKTGKIDK